MLKKFTDINLILFASVSFGEPVGVSGPVWEPLIAFWDLCELVGLSCSLWEPWGLFGASVSLREYLTAFGCVRELWEAFGCLWGFLGGFCSF